MQTYIKNLTWVMPLETFLRRISSEEQNGTCIVLLAYKIGETKNLCMFAASFIQTQFIL